jgi:hypothetical protein
LQLLSPNKLALEFRGNFKPVVPAIINFDLVGEIDARVTRLGESSLRVAPFSIQPLHGDVLGRVRQLRADPAADSNERQNIPRLNIVGDCKNDKEMRVGSFAR